LARCWAPAQGPPGPLRGDRSSGFNVGWHLSRVFFTQARQCLFFRQHPGQFSGQRCVIDRFCPGQRRMMLEAVVDHGEAVARRRRLLHGQGLDSVPQWTSDFRLAWKEVAPTWTCWSLGEVDGDGLVGIIRWRWLIISRRRLQLAIRWRRGDRSPAPLSIDDIVVQSILSI